MFMVQLLILLLMIFVGLVVLLRKLMGQHATTVMTHLHGLSQDYLKKQDEIKQRLEEAEQQYQTQLAKAQEEAQQLKTQALKDADALRHETIERARQEAERIVQQAIQGREALQHELTQTMNAQAVQRACELLQGVWPEELRQAAHALWFDALLKNGLISSAGLDLPKGIKEARVLCAFALTAPQRAHLLERLQAAVGSPVALHETVDPSLIAGLTITLGHLVLDGSLASKLLEAARHAQETIA